MKTRNSAKLSARQKLFVRNVMSDPVLFASHVLGVDLWEREAEILRSIKTHRRTAVKACHGVGKTFTHSSCGLVVARALPRRHCPHDLAHAAPGRTQLWSEIHRLVDRAKVPYPKLKTTELKFRGDNNFALGFSTNQAENFQGYHGKYVLIIADEAPGIESGLWDAIAGTMAGGKVHIVMAGNPTVPSGAFFDAFTQERSLWNCISISAFDSPNLAGFDLEHLLRLDPIGDGSLDQNPYAFLVTKRWVYEQHQLWWHGTESSSPQWLSRVLARFPDQAQNALIKMVWLERAKRRALQDPVSDSTSGPLVAGVDVGAGEAETVAYVCEYGSDRRKIIRMGAWRGEDTRGQVVAFLNQFRPRLAVVRVDSIGIGHNFGLHLRDCRFPVEMINVGMACESKPGMGENDPARRFVNLKACFFQALADAFERDQIEGLSDEATIGQLAGLLYELDSQGRMKIESKEQARARGVPSPDRADALMLAFSKPYQKMEYTPAPRRRPVFDERRFDDDDDDHRIKRRRWPRGFELI